MIWLAMAVLALLTVAPLGFAAWRGVRLRGRREAAMALHRAQLSELDRDLADARILPEEHLGAKLEVQRRLLADAALPDAVSERSGSWPIYAAGVLIPAVALGLYLVGGHPEFPPKGPSPAEQAQASEDDKVIESLRSHLATMNPDEPKTLEGYTILGNAELTRGRLPEAADAWKHVLAKHFDATLAVETAEVTSEMEGRVTPEAAALFRRGLAEGPKDAAWRPMAEKRLAQEPAPAPPVSDDPKAVKK
jgi:cytochrome c-type biogenesis protein CcmH